MALTTTTAASAILATDAVVNVTSATGFTVGNFLRVDTEMMRVTVVPATGTLIGVIRGIDGTAVVAHNILAIMTTGLFSDLQPVAQGKFVTFPADETQQVTYSVTGAIAVPTQNTQVFLNKAGVAAMTLAAPAKGQDGLILTITSTTAQAHTVTATALYSTGTASVNLATFAANKGSGMVLMAAGGLWSVMSATGITFS